MTTSPVEVGTETSVPDSSRDRVILARLRRASGQLNGIATMHEQGRLLIDILDQLAAVNAAVDAVALLLLEDRVRDCLRAAVREGDFEEQSSELTAAVRRYVRST